MKRNLLTRTARKFLLLCGYQQLHRDAHTSFSQMGEDLIVKQIIGAQKKGFYVDVGAFHPTLYSNTFIFYQMGWRGINIDAMPGSMKIFESIRPRDINIEMAVGKKMSAVQYYKSNAPALNTLSPTRAEAIRRMKKFMITDNIEIPVEPLSAILERNLPKKQKIDFLSVDVEGMDIEVLKSNNWKKFRPKVIIVESFTFNLEKPDNDLVYKYLKNQNYVLAGKSDVSLIFKSRI